MKGKEKYGNVGDGALSFKECCLKMSLWFMLVAAVIFSGCAAVPQEAPPVETKPRPT